MGLRFYKCKVCGKVIYITSNEGVPTVCCGKEMAELIPDSVDAAFEKHVPNCAVAGNKVVVEVGEVPHPMKPEHYIEWVALKTCCGAQFWYFKPGDEPKASFMLRDNEEPEAVYAYCNLHELWIHKF